MSQFGRQSGNSHAEAFVNRAIERGYISDNECVYLSFLERKLSHLKQKESLSRFHPLLQLFGEGRDRMQALARAEYVGPAVSVCSEHIRTVCTAYYNSLGWEVTIEGTATLFVILCYSDGN